MNLQAQFTSPEKIRADWLITCVWADKTLDPATEKIDQSLDGIITNLVESKDISGKANEVVPVYGCSGIAAKKVLVLGLGDQEKADFHSLTNAASAACRFITTKEINTIALAIPEPSGNLTLDQVTRAMTIGLALGGTTAGIRKKEPDRFSPEKIILAAPDSATQAEIKEAVRRGEIEADAVRLTRELVNLPPCDLFPETFAERAQEVTKDRKIKCEVFDQERLEKEKMGSLLGVAQGSDRPPRLVVLRYNGDKKSGKTLGLVGKGVTFDSGGLSLKPSDGMLDMKCDMAGAATVLGAIQAIADLKLPVNVIGVMALVENMPSGKALKLGDVLRARNGKTIEIHNTDAEGRLILADALSYAVDQKVDHLVDLATLTGACMVALGTEIVGVMSNNDQWSNQVQSAAAEAGELVWPLPMFPLFGEMIKSKVADIKNTGGKRWGGAITAAKLLEEFVEDVPWVHLDIAGPAFADDENPTRPAGGTGVMVRTLVQLAKEY